MIPLAIREGLSQFDNDFMSDDCDLRLKEGLLGVDSLALDMPNDVLRLAAIHLDIVLVDSSVVCFCRGRVRELLSCFFLHLLLLILRLADQLTRERFRSSQCFEQLAGLESDLKVILVGLNGGVTHAEVNLVNQEGFHPVEIAGLQISGRVHRVEVLEDHA